VLLGPTFDTFFLCWGAGSREVASARELQEQSLQHHWTKLHSTRHGADLEPHPRADPTSPAAIICLSAMSNGDIRGYAFEWTSPHSFSALLQGLGFPRIFANFGARDGGYGLCRSVNILGLDNSSLAVE